MIPDPSCHAHGGHQPALLAPAVDDGHQVDVVRNDVAATPSRHVEVLVEHGLADVLELQVLSFLLNWTKLTDLPQGFSIKQMCGC